MGAPLLEGKGEGWAETGRAARPARAARSAEGRAAAEGRAVPLPPPCRVGRRRTSPRGAAPHPVQAGRGRQGLVRTPHRWGWLRVSPRRRRGGTTAEWAGGATPQTGRRLAGQARHRWGPRQAPTRAGAKRNAPLALGQAATEQQVQGRSGLRGAPTSARGREARAPCAQPSITGLHRGACACLAPRGAGADGAQGCHGRGACARNGRVCVKSRVPQETGAAGPAVETVTHCQPELRGGDTSSGPALPVVTPGRHDAGLTGHLGFAACTAAPSQQRWKRPAWSAPLHGPRWPWS